MTDFCSRSFELVKLGVTMFLMAGLLIIGLIANLLVRPVDSKYHTSESPKT